MGQADDTSIADQVIKKLGDYLGPHTAKSAVKTFCRRAFKRTPDTLTVDDIPALLEVMHPMLRTLVGEVSANVLIDVIQREVRK
jgi:hypothetical protein